MKIGIVLSGGGSRGIAHVGILKALEEFGIHPGIISGTSAGAIIGALYTYGYKPDEILEIIMKTRLLRILRPAFTKSGLLTLENTYYFFNSLLPTDSFDSLKFPMDIWATNLKKVRKTIFNSGSMFFGVMPKSTIQV